MVVNLKVINGLQFVFPKKKINRKYKCEMEKMEKITTM